MKHFEVTLQRSLHAIERSRRRLQAIRGASDDPRLPDLSGLAVVVVEDDQDCLDVVTMFLQACGAGVMGSRTAHEALEHLAVKHADVIVTDVSMPAMGGVDFIRSVRAFPRHAATPVIAVTGWSREDADASESAFSAFMLKPVDLDALCAMILMLVRRI